MIQHVLLLTLSFAASARADLILDALRWFPRDAQAVVSVRSPITIRPWEDHVELLDGDPPNSADLVAWAVLLDLLDLPVSDELGKALFGRNISAGILAASKVGDRFEDGGMHTLSGIGYLPACAVFQFPEQLPDAPWHGKQFLRKSLPYGRPRQSKPEPERVLYLERLRPDLLLVCNDEASYQATRRGFAFPGARSRFETGEVWKPMLEAARIWGMRVQQKQQVLFHTSPQLHEMLNEITTREVGLFNIEKQIEAEPGKEAALQMHFLLLYTGFVAQLEPKATSAP